MPKTGFRSITIRESNYDYLHSMYVDLKERGRVPPGIHSFSGYVDRKLDNHIKEKEALHKLAISLKKDGIPESFLETITVIKTMLP